MTEFDNLNDKMQELFPDAFDHDIIMGQELSKKLNSQKVDLPDAKKWSNEITQISDDNFFLYHIQEITYEEKAPQKDAVENVFGTFRGMEGVNLLYCILGNARTVDFYLGLALTDEFKDTITASDLCSKMLEPAISGNFRGCRLEKVEVDEKPNILSKLVSGNSVGMLEGVPSIDEQKENFQGTDRLIDVMQGEDFGIIVIANPHSESKMRWLADMVYTAADKLNAAARYTMQRTKSANSGSNESKGYSNSRQKSHSTQTAKSIAHNTTDMINHDHRTDKSCQNSYSQGDSYSLSSGDSINDSDNHSENSGSHTYGKSKNTTRNTTSLQKQAGLNKNIGSSAGDSTVKGVQHVDTDNVSDSESDGKSISISKSTGSGSSLGVSMTKVEQLNTESKKAADWLAYIDEVLLRRLDQGNGKGIFQVCTYLFATRRVPLYRLANTMISLYSGPKGNRAPLHFTELNDSFEGTAQERCLKYLHNFQIPFAKKTSDSDFDYMASAVMSRWDWNGTSFRGSWMSSEELGILAGFPKREVLGLPLREEVEFGLNVNDVAESNRLNLGKLVQYGRENRRNKNTVYLNKKELDSHTFITGVTGSGKTTTCRRLLSSSGLPFMVIEPAKTEYRGLPALRTCRNVIYFTPGRQGVAPFFLNPFELFPGEEIASRADMIKATFEASFDMEAAIPQIMEAAIYDAYERKGWDTGTTRWCDKEDDAPDGPFADGQQAFPTLSDFKASVKFVIDKQGFDDRLNQEYLGSINARIDSLLLGAKGQMLNVARSIDFSDLVKRQVVIELEGLKSGTEKSMLMGFILTNLMQAVKQQKKANPNFQHITLIEEAHRLLSKYMPGDSLSKKQGVEVFSDMLAEVRKYGESLVIVDQIPDKMTPEVLKNTNTKIIHKLFAQDDKDAIGNTMLLKDEQKSYLSNLPKGRAIVFSQGWTKAIQVQVTDVNVTDDEELSDDDLHERILKYYSLPQAASRYIISRAKEGLSLEEVDELLTIRQETYGWLLLLKDAINKLQLADDVTTPKKIYRGMKQAVKHHGSDILIAWVLSQCPISKTYELENEDYMEYERMLVEFVKDMIEIDDVIDAKERIIKLITDIKDLCNE